MSAYVCAHIHAAPSDVPKGPKHAYLPKDRNVRSSKFMKASHWMRPKDVDAEISKSHSGVALSNEKEGRTRSRVDLRGREADPQECAR